MSATLRRQLASEGLVSRMAGALCRHQGAYRLTQYGQGVLSAVGASLWDHAHLQRRRGEVQRGLACEVVLPSAALAT